LNQIELEETIRSILSVEHLQVVDLTGTRDHWQVLVVSAEFADKSRVEQHQLIMEPLQKRFGSNEIHAMALKTFTPEKWEKVKDRY